MRLRRYALALLLSAVVSPAQLKLTVDQLMTFIKSSIELRHEDRRVADYLKKVRLTERLDDRTIEEMQGMGAGIKTIESLRLLRDASKELPAPPKPRQKPAPAVIPPPGEAEQKQILDFARDYALNYTKRLPDFICTQVTRRFVDPSGLEFFQRQDVITARLSYFEQKEKYEVFLVNGRMTNDVASFEQLGGATSSGEFGSMMKEIFDPKTEATFEWSRWATLRGKRMHVYRYRVRKDKSQWLVSWQRQAEVMPAYAGDIFVDNDTNLIMRIVLDAEMPADFPIQQAKTILDYDYTSISEQQYVLPLKAEVRMREGRVLVKNEVEFRMYRKFGAEATIKFETPEPLPDSATKEGPPK
jgi:hypothetical protein